MIKTQGKTTTQHRGNLDIIADILNASHGGIKKTYLMYRCNLSFRQLKHYSHFLLRSGLLRIASHEAEPNIGMFEVTDKGIKFLKAYNGLKALTK